eukprot:CAMPEP_0119143114 /NCGR_PEP_ID=MMETSP1310-20130426/33825_1 /TAXON_ID=464262 /ORGANISM="Genus nov. species nov., Strain RCC2339" /LENGTH=81 /DNA_ID=CAMNT_0007134713 /DNA_START=52 /DNA_END=293 /DNA_ORIENTATION=+
MRDAVVRDTTCSVERLAQAYLAGENLGELQTEVAKLHGMNQLASVERTTVQGLIARLTGTPEDDVPAAALDRTFVLLYLIT